MKPTSGNVGEFWWIRWRLTGEVSVARVTTVCWPPNTTDAAIHIGVQIPGRFESFPEEAGWFEWLGRAVPPEMSNTAPASNAIQKAAEKPVQVRPLEKLQA